MSVRPTATELKAMALRQQQQIDTQQQVSTLNINIKDEINVSHYKPFRLLGESSTLNNFEVRRHFCSKYWS